jgi:tetratricopeptide (TPR) repeat protein
MIDRSAALARLREATSQLIDAARGSRHEEALAELLDLGASLQQSGMTFAVEEVLTAVASVFETRDTGSANHAWLLNLSGWRHLQRGNLSRARDEFSQMLAVAKALRDPWLRATAYLNLGNAIWLLGDARKAAELFRLSQDRGGDSPADDYGRLQSVLSEAAARFDAGEVEGAERLLDRLEAEGTVTDPHLVATLNGLRGQAAARRGEFAQALAHFRTTAAEARKSGDLGQYLTTLQNIGAVNLDLGKHGVAIRWLRRARRLALALDSFRELDAIERTLATALHKSGRTAEARSELEAARLGAIKREDRGAWARLTADLGALMLLSDRPDASLEMLVDAQRWFLETGDSQWALLVTHNLAEAMVRADRADEADASILEAFKHLRLRREIRSQFFVDLADTLLSRNPDFAARLYRRSVQTLRPGAEAAFHLLAESGAKLADASADKHAIQLFGLALRRRQAVGASEVAQALNDRGIAYLASGSRSRAQADLEGALALAREADDRVMESLVLQNLSELLRRKGESEQAVNRALEGLGLARRTADSHRLPEILGTLGLALHSSGRSDEAWDAFAEALALARKSRATDAQAVAYGGMAGIEWERGQYRRAKRLYHRALEIERRTGDTRHEAETVAALLEINSALLQLDELQAHAQRLVDLAQEESVPVEVALDALERSALVFMRKEHLSEAASVYAQATLLAASSSRGDDEALVAAMGRHLLAPFVHAAMLGHPPEAQVRAALKVSLAEAFGELPPVMDEMLDLARQAAEGIEPDVEFQRRPH